jgi:hypothetical protein
MSLVTPMMDIKFFISWFFMLRSIVKKSILVIFSRAGRPRISFKQLFNKKNFYFHYDEY